LLYCKGSREVYLEGAAALPPGTQQGSLLPASHWAYGALLKTIYSMQGPVRQIFVCPAAEAIMGLKVVRQILLAQIPSDTILQVILLQAGSCQLAGTRAVPSCLPFP